jgi:hypothetical protein
VTPFPLVGLFTDYGVVGALALMIAPLFVLKLTVAELGIDPRPRGLEDPGSDAAGATTDQAPATAR